MEGPLPPLTKIVDDVEGVGVEVMLALKSMRCGRGCGGRGCDVGRFERRLLRRFGNSIAPPSGAESGTETEKVTLH